MQTGSCHRSDGLEWQAISVAIASLRQRYGWNGWGFQHREGAGSARGIGYFFFGAAGVGFGVVTTTGSL